LEEGDVIESKSLESVDKIIKELIYKVVESKSDLEAEDRIEDLNSDIEHKVDDVVASEGTVKKGDVISESSCEAVFR